MSYSSPVSQLDASPNYLLVRLDQEAYLRLKAHLRPVILESKQVVYPAGSRIRHVLFPETAVLCMLTLMKDGRTVESATVGREGASWISASVGAPSMPCQTMAVIAGRAQSLDVRYLEEELERNGRFHNLLSRYSHALLIQALRTGACNALHSLHERCARWMLTTLDRTDESSFAVTHEFLASLIGCGRPVLTLILRDLEAAGAITLYRGAIHVRDRSVLEAASCECYEIIRENHVFANVSASV